MTTLVLLTLPTLCSDHARVAYNFQEQCMQRLIHLSNRSRQERADFFEARGILRSNKITSSCEWEHVLCTEGAVTAIIWERLLRDVRIDMRWIPPGVVRVYLRNQNIGNLFNVAYLPKSLEYLNFEGSKMQGSADLTKLPKPMRHFIANGNELTGFADLTRLPPSIQHIEMRRNHIEKVYGTIDDLPTSLKKACFGQYHKKIQYVALDKRAKDPRIVLWIVRKRKAVNILTGPGFELIEEQL